MTAAVSNQASVSTVSTGRHGRMQSVLRLGVFLCLLCGLALASTRASAAPPQGPLVVAAAALALDGKININTATGTQLKLLPGVGPATAAKIMAYRIRRPFTHPTHLLRIKGIGRKTFGAMRRYISVEGETTLRVPDA